MPEKPVVVLIHGIRTAAWWQNRIASLIEADTGATVIPIKYGYFDLLRFLCPFCRSGPVEKLRQQLEGIVNTYKDRPLIIFAHSFGTYALTRVIDENPFLRFDRIVLCGSVVPTTFDWRKVQEQVRGAEKRNAIINECGTRDIWPVLAQSVTWGYGATGTYGFGTFNVRDRFHDIAHSDFFTNEFARKYWVPLVRGEAVAFSEQDVAGAGAPGWLMPVRLVPLRWLAVAGLAGIVALAGVNLTAFAMRCPTGAVRTDDGCIETREFKSRKELDEQVSTLLIDINRTLDLKGSELFPAMDDYVGDPVPERWQVVLAIAEKLLTHLGKGLDDISRYNAALARLDGKVIFIASDVRVAVGDDFFEAFNEARTQFTGRATIIAKMRGAGPTPDPIVVQGWRNQLAELHVKLTRTLEELLRRLRAA